MKKVNNEFGVKNGDYTASANKILVFSLIAIVLIIILIVLFIKIFIV